MRRWIGRLAFSFIVLAAVLFWEGRRAREAGRSPIVFNLTAAVLAAVGLFGLRERHRPPPPDR